MKLSALVPTLGGRGGFACALRVLDVFFFSFFKESICDNASGSGFRCTADFWKTTINPSVTCTCANLSVATGD